MLEESTVGQSLVINDPAAPTRAERLALALAGAAGAALTAGGVAFYRRPLATLRAYLRLRLLLSGVVERTVDVDGLPLRYFEAGPRAGRANGGTLVLIHGLGDAAETWARVLPALARDYRTLAPDLAGFGRTPIPPEGMRFSVLTGYLARFLDAVAPEPVALVGNSLGGAVAMRYVAARPDRVRHLFLLNSAGWPGEIPPALEPTTCELARELAEIAGGKPYRRLPRFILDDLIRRAQDPARRAYLASPERTDVSADLPRITVPTTLIWGERDRLFPFGNAGRLRDAIRGAELIVLPEVGHGPQAEAPREVVAIIRERLRMPAGAAPPPPEGRRSVVES
ncbi:MAG: alpha/beta fold hydrolase [Chloroflexota bacterium]|nr:alpha/beta fold hydrolase [Chloroflexota bacterium]